MSILEIAAWYLVQSNCLHLARLGFLQSTKRDQYSHPLLAFHICLDTETRNGILTILT